MFVTPQEVVLLLCLFTLLFLLPCNIATTTPPPVESNNELIPNQPSSSSSSSKAMQFHHHTAEVVSSSQSDPRGNSCITKKVVFRSEALSTVTLWSMQPPSPKNKQSFMLFVSPVAMRQVAAFSDIHIPSLLANVNAIYTVLDLLSINPGSICSCRPETLCNSSTVHRALTAFAGNCSIFTQSQSVADSYTFAAVLYRCIVLDSFITMLNTKKMIRSLVTQTRHCTALRDVSFDSSIVDNPPTTTDVLTQAILAQNISLVAQLYESLLSSRLLLPPPAIVAEELKQTIRQAPSSSFLFVLDNQYLVDNWKVMDLLTTYSFKSLPSFPSKDVVIPSVTQTPVPPTAEISEDEENGPYLVVDRFHIYIVLSLLLGGLLIVVLVLKLALKCCKKRGRGLPMPDRAEGSEDEMDEFTNSDDDMFLEAMHPISVDHLASVVVAQPTPQDCETVADEETPPGGGGGGVGKRGIKKQD
jgi:hypothetical protein